MYRMLVWFLALTLASVVLCCAAPSEPKGPFVVEMQWIDGNDVYGDSPDVYETWHDCYEAMPNYIAPNVIFVGCSQYVY